MSNLSGFHVLPVLVALAAPLALAQPAPESAKEQRRSSAPKKIPANARAPESAMKSAQQEAKDNQDRKMKRADTELATGIGSARQGMGGMPARKSSHPGHVAKDVRKPALQPQSGSLKK